MVKGLKSYSSNYGTLKQKKKEIEPYLEVITIQSQRFVGNGKAMGNFRRPELLIEPVHLPDLKHAGIEIMIQEKVPIFYSNGAKNINLRDTIMDSLGTSDVSFEDYSSVPAAPPSISKLRSKAIARSKEASKYAVQSEYSPAKSKSVLSAPRTVDDTTNALLESVRANNKRMENLLSS